MADGRDNGEHAFAGPLLPWYANDSLEARERERIGRHLEQCRACRGDLELLQRVHSAVRRSAATPILPPPRPERLLGAIDGRDLRHRRLRRAGFAAGAAALAALVFVAGIVASGLGDAPPARFRTLTSEPRAIAMDYVLDLRFEAGLSAAERSQVLGELRATQVEPGTPEGRYRVVLKLPAWSLAELDAFTRRIEARPEVRSARVVAMQLPMQPRP